MAQVPHQRDSILMSFETVVDRKKLEKQTFLSGIAAQRSSANLREIVLSLAHQLGNHVDLAELNSDADERRLAAHTEAVYRRIPTRYFILACLRPSATGGETTVFDARIAADLIKKQAPELASVKIEYRSGSHRGSAVHELVQARSSSEGGQSVLVFRERAATNRILALPPCWSEATFYSFMSSHVLTKSVACQHSWTTGDVLIVDNYVSLHSREGFSGARSLLRARIRD